MNAARRALLLLLAINLFSYMDRYILAAVLKPIRDAFFAPGDPEADFKAGLLTSVFFISYMLTAPVFGWLADRSSRWVIIGCAVGLWSLASGASGLATGYFMLLGTRVFLGIGEAGYGPSAPTLLSDYFPLEKRGRVMAFFYMAIPVGSALGFAFGGLASHWWSWRAAFWVMTPPGLVLAALALFMRDPRQASPAAAKHPELREYGQLLRIPSLVLNILAQTAFTFALGGLAVWAPTYLAEARGFELHRADTIFGAILAVTGLTSTLAGGWLGDRLRARWPGSYFLVSGVGMLVGFPATAAMLFVPVAFVWPCVFVAMFFLFLNTGPSNTALANVAPRHLRATAFALNILVIHALGDVVSPPLIGWVKGHFGWNTAFLTVSLVMLVAGVLWLAGMGLLARDTARESLAEQGTPA